MTYRKHSISKKIEHKENPIIHEIKNKEFKAKDIGGVCKLHFCQVLCP